MVLPVTAGRTKIAGIKIHDTRMMRLIEVLLRSGTQLNRWRSPNSIKLLTTFGLSPTPYALTQLRCGLCTMKAHGLLERIGRACHYRLSDEGTKAVSQFSSTTNTLNADQRRFWPAQRDSPCPVNSWTLR